MSDDYRCTHAVKYRKHTSVVSSLGFIIAHKAKHLKRGFYELSMFILCLTG